MLLFKNTTRTLAKTLKKHLTPVRTYSNKTLLKPAKGDKNAVLFWALKHQTPVTLRELFDFGQNLTKWTFLMSAQFLQRELPIRLAKRIRELERLPHGLSETPSIRQLIELYQNSFWAIVDIDEIKSNSDEEKLTNVLEKVLGDHDNVRGYITEGIQELVNLKHSKGETLSSDVDFSPYLNSFYLTRIGIRLLARQHVKLHNPEPGFVGTIQRECYPAKIAEEAAQDAADLCRLYYGEAPEVKFLGDQNIHMPYIPSHLYYIFFEILKNSMRAVVERHSKSGELPPITITLGEGEEDLTVKISDQGGGIPRSVVKRIWSYAYSDADHPTETAKTHSYPAMAGYGHGLPFSRLYARYFGGDLKLISIRGFGTDTYIYISKLQIDEQLS
eukprot:TRINITY_DN9450_c0_g1_i2.p1 TRINITY_DN9450_c0_g1~~TRINITY_DN9450_c0_g1_i2.p1  ORF type:complete len:387 (-),score=49.87 TRINITY_DN9450_c0_g1_i2:5-1165(-)